MQNVYGAISYFNIQPLIGFKLVDVRKLPLYSETYSKIALLETKKKQKTKKKHPAVVWLVLRTGYLKRLSFMYRLSG